ncbi:MAG: hypothetical protein ACJAZR_002715 [Sediminicola sp.]|jgi:hypothetical protein
MIRPYWKYSFFFKEEAHEFESKVYILTKGTKQH